MLQCTNIVSRGNNAFINICIMDENFIAALFVDEKRGILTLITSGCGQYLAQGCWYIVASGWV